jgi:hypothetical protein
MMSSANVSGGPGDDGHELRLGGHQRPPERGCGAAGSTTRREPCWVRDSFLALHHRLPTRLFLLAFIMLWNSYLAVCARHGRLVALQTDVHRRRDINGVSVQGHRNRPGVGSDAWDEGY